jgi:undecaprenyl-diphosphatase
MQIPTARLRWGGRGPAFLAAAAASLMVWAFLALTGEVLGEEPTPGIHAADRAVLLALASIRVGWLNATAVDLTALGSPVVLVLFVLGLSSAFLRFGRRRSAAILAASGLGAVALTGILKILFERARPEVVPRLVEVSGFSYPSGHSLAAAAVYGTAAVLLAVRARSRAERLAVGAAGALLLVSVGASRVYLGVHHPSDVLGGISLGLAWSFALVAVGAWRREVPPAPGGEEGA